MPRPGEKASFEQETAAISAYGHWRKSFFRTNLEFDWDVTVLPQGITRGTMLSPAMYGVSSSSKYPEAAWELLKYVTYEPGALDLIQFGEAIPVVRHAANLRAFMEINPPQNNQAFLDSFAYAHGEWLNHPNGGEIKSLIQSELGAVWKGDKSAQEVVEAITPALDALISGK